MGLETVRTADAEVERLRAALASSPAPLSDDEVAKLVDALEATSQEIRAALVSGSVGLPELRGYRVAIHRFVAEVRRFADDDRMPSAGRHAVLGECTGLEMTAGLVESRFHAARREPLRAAIHAASWDSLDAGRGVVSYRGDSVADVSALYDRG